MTSLGDTFDKTGFDRKLGRGKAQRFLGDIDGNAIDLEQDAAGLHAYDPKLWRTFTFAHAHFDWLLRNRHVGKHPDPNATRSLHEASKRTARGLDLARGDAFRFERLEAVLAKGKCGATRGNTMNASLERLAELRADRLQHDLISIRSLSGRRFATWPTCLAFSELLVLRHRIVFEDLALEDPHFHSAGAIGGECCRDAIIDVGAQRMERHASLAIPFHAGDFGAAQAAGAVDADAFRPKTHRRLHGALHRASEGNAAFELLGDRFGHELCVKLRLANFNDVDHDVAVRELGNRLAKLLDVGALLADHHARTRRVDRHTALLVRPLYHDV